MVVTIFAPLPTLYIYCRTLYNYTCIADCNQPLQLIKNTRAYYEVNPMSTDEKKVYTPKDLEQILSGVCGRTRIYELLQSGSIKSLRLGRKYLIPVSEVRRLVGD